ncbi:hypothetical protein BDA96_02G273100 [Sorghum bicolor]|uniref:Uncharacterized protein n=2 Tax=Sorghum bicolor TaxID=4558 RepID=A0A921RS01_SORBI|nr:hypothetical protein BDA96_02G273100 [Sorghum bicolor]KXG35987.1 hypothetical protein SORBI_3002G260500 [Sorghum bicolor]
MRVAIAARRHLGHGTTASRALCHFHRRQSVGLAIPSDPSIDSILPRVSDPVSPALHVSLVAPPASPGTLGRRGPGRAAQRW